ncbi:hypothetical protein Lser_V15G40137 [Lactuca serriola]
MFATNVDEHKRKVHYTLKFVLHEALDLVGFNTTYARDTLEDFDGVSKGKYTIGLGQDCMAFCSEVEDVISMGWALNELELEDLFSTAPENPWNEAPYANAAENNALERLSLDGFLSQMENLINISYSDDPSSAIHVTRKRHVDRNKKHSDINVFQCFVFGPKESGKSSLLNSFVGRPFVEVYTPTIQERYAVNVFDQLDKLLLNKDGLAALLCD